MHKDVVEEDEVMGGKSAATVEGDGTGLTLPDQSPAGLPQ